MKFEPLLFIRLAYRNGISLTKIEGNLIVAEDAPPEWIPAIRKHKRQLLKHLPEAKERSLNLDLFDDF